MSQHLARHFSTWKTAPCSFGPLNLSHPDPDFASPRSSVSPFFSFVVTSGELSFPFSTFSQVRKQPALRERQHVLQKRMRVCLIVVSDRPGADPVKLTRRLQGITAKANNEFIGYDGENWTFWSN